MDFRVCNKCGKPIYYENDKPMSTCDCETPTDPWECDEDVYHLVRALWYKGYETEFSCSGHSLSRYYSDANKWIVSDAIDINGYIVIPGSCVRVKDLEKYKYGCAYIEKSNTMDAYIQQMIQVGLDVPDPYIITKDDPLFLRYANDFNSKADAEAMIKQLSTPETWYAIRVEPTIYFKQYDSAARRSLKAYMELMESRYDMAKLIDLLPVNTKED